MAGPTSWAPRASPCGTAMAASTRHGARGSGGRFPSSRSCRWCWRLRPDDRRGLTLGIRLATGGPPRRARQAPTVEPPRFDPPSEGELITLGRASGGSPDGARVAPVRGRTAYGGTGAPYNWGGSGGNGYGRPG